MASAAGQEVQRRGILMAGESGIFTPEHVTAVQVTLSSSGLGQKPRP